MDAKPGKGGQGPSWTQTRVRSYAFLVGAAVFGLLAVASAFGLYCSGTWGQSNALLKTSLNCLCPSDMEPARHPGKIIVVSGCDYDRVSVVPGGNFVLAQKAVGDEIRIELVDARTGGRHRLSPDSTPLGIGHIQFLNERLFYSGSTRHTIYEWETGRSIQPHELVLRNLQDEYDSVEEIPREVIQPFHEAAHVYLLRMITRTVAIGLASDPWADGAENVYMGPAWVRFYVPGKGKQYMVDLFEAQDLQFEEVGGYTVVSDWGWIPYAVGQISPDGSLIIQQDGVYSVDSGELVKELHAIPLGWDGAGRGVIVLPHQRYLFRGLEFSGGDLLPDWRLLPPMGKLREPVVIVPLIP